MSARHRSTSIIVGMAIVAVVLPVLAAVPPFSSFQTQNSWIDGFTNAGVFVLLALGLNLVVGVAGLLDLGYAAFFAIGAYAYAYAASPFGNEILGIDIAALLGDAAGLIFWPMLIIGALVAATFGILLGAPTLRLRGDYLAIVTLGFGEIVPIVFLNSDDLTNGTNGIGGIYRPYLPGVGSFSAVDPWPYYITMMVIITVVMIFCYRLAGSRLGRAWEAIREDELAAAANGINTVTTKLLAFALGASTAGIAGVFNAAKLTVVSPDQFGFVVSFTVLAMVVLGGMGNFWGVAVGAFVIYTINNVLLKTLNQFFDALGIPILQDIDFIQLQFLLYGIALVGMMLLRPEGLFPNSRRKRELHAEVTEPGEDEMTLPEVTEEGGR
ncbi:MAG: branched-chain amino acid ABC transporter permease [Chloroflexi bacterium]|nr:branched-chain amino acid ABC transporter permease [Chloroflexota bacterium]